MRAPLRWSVFAGLLVPAFIDPGVFTRLDALRSAVDPGADASWLTLHVWAPLVALSVTLVIWLPGLPLALVWVRRGVWQTVVGVAVALDLLLLAVVVPIVERLGLALTGRMFLLFCLGTAALGMLLVRSRVAASRRDTPSPFVPLALVALVVAPICLLPGKFLWESLNGDGAHALESARLLVHGPVPFWDPAAGLFASFPGITSFVFAYPSSWMMRAIGELDVAARLPFAGYLALLVVAAGDLARTDSSRRDVPPVLLLTGPLAYALAMAFSATYNPYSADIALPATQDTLLMVSVLGAFAAWIRDDRRTFCLLASVAFFSLPNGLMLLGLLGPATLLIERPVPWRRLVILMVGLLVLLVAGALAPVVLRAVGLPVPGKEYGAAGLLRYFAFVQFTDLHRLLWVAVMAGIAPLLTPLRWRTLDQGSRMVLVAAGLYFAMFHVMAYVSLHYFVPVAALLIGVHWRSLAEHGFPARRVAIGAVAAGVAAILALPRDAAPHRDGELIGRKITVVVPGYEDASAEYFGSVPLLRALFPRDWEPSSPARYSGSALTWNRYARRDSVVGGAAYTLIPLHMPDPAGMHEVARGDKARLFVRSDDDWERDRARQPMVEPGSPLLAVPRGVLFRTVPRGSASRAWDVLAELDARGLAPQALKRLRQPPPQSPP